MGKYLLILVKKKRKDAGGRSVPDYVKALAGKLQEEGVPFYRFLFPYVDTVQVTEKYDTAVYVGDWLLLSADETVRTAVEVALEWLAKAGWGAFSAEVLELDDPSQAAGRIPHRSLLGQYQKEAGQGVALCEFQGDVSALLQRGMYELKLRECAGVCLAWEEICRRQIRLRGGRCFVCAQLHFVFEIPAAEADAMMEKLAREFQDKIAAVYGKIAVKKKTVTV